MSKYKTLVKDISATLPALGGNIPDVMKGFGGLAKASTKAGSLDTKTKELIAIAIAVATRCDGCIGFHSKALVELGVTEAELSEALGVAILMGGGPSVMYAANALSAFKEFAE